MGQSSGGPSSKGRQVLRCGSVSAPRWCASGSVVGVIYAPRFAADAGREQQLLRQVELSSQLIARRIDERLDEMAAAAVPLAASIAHAVHGAIGITEEFALQRIVKPLHEWRMAAGSESYWARILGETRMGFADAPSVDFVRTIA